MENKVLIKVLLPEADLDYDIFIPVNELVWKIKKMLIKSISDLSGIKFSKNDYILINKDTGVIYENNQTIIDTDIRNATELFLDLLIINVKIHLIH